MVVVELVQCLDLRTDVSALEHVDRGGGLVPVGEAISRTGHWSQSVMITINYLHVVAYAKLAPCGTAAHHKTSCSSDVRA